MDEVMLKVAEEANEERKAAIASIRNNNCEIIPDPYSVYVSKRFSKTSDALEFLNTHHINPSDVVSLIKHGGETSVSEYELIFFNRIKIENYSIVDEKWIDGNPRLFKESAEVFSDKSIFMVDSKFNSLLHFPLKHKDEYKHVYVLRQELEWMSGDKIITDIRRSDNQSDPDNAIDDSKSRESPKSCSYPERY